MKRHLKRLRHFLKDEHKKPVLIILKEVLLLWISKREFPLHYFGRFHYRTDAPKNISDYLTLKQYNRINAYMVYCNKQTPTVFTILDNKLMLYYFCKENNFPTPDVYSYNLKSCFYFNGQKCLVNTTAELKDFFYGIFQQQSVKKIFLKPIQGFGGYGAFILTKEKLDAEADHILDILKNDSYVHQEVVVQNDTINAISPNTVNTIRIETYSDHNANIHLMGCFMRFGHGKMAVDNASSGGIMVIVNPEKGQLVGSGGRSLIYGTAKHTRHPDTEVKFDGFKIPYFNEVKSLVINLSKNLPCRFHGWDIALTPDGPTIIEGNYTPGLLYSERTYNGYKNKPIFKEILNDANAYHKKRNRS